MKMVYHCLHQHVYRYSFDQYLQIELDRQFRIEEEYKTSVQLIEKVRDPEDGNQRTVLKTTWKNIIPESLQKVNGLDLTEIQFEEEFWVNENQQGYWKRCRNISLDNMFQIWLASTGLKDRNNSNWTYSEEEGSVEIFSKDKSSAILENVLGKFIENLIKKRIDKTELSLMEKYRFVQELPLT